MSQQPFPVTRRCLLAGAAAVISGVAPAGAQDARLVLEGRDGRLALAGANGVPSARLLTARQGQAHVFTFENGLDVPVMLDWPGLRGPSPLTEVLPRAVAAAQIQPVDAGTMAVRMVATGAGRLTLPLVVHARAPLAVHADLLALIDVAPDGPGLPLAVLTVLAQADAPQAGGLTRLRLVNGSDAALVQIRVGPGPATLLALDSQPSEPMRLEDGTIMLGAGQRCDMGLGGEAGTTPRLLLTRISAAGQPLHDAVRVALPVVLPAPSPAGVTATLPANPLDQRLDLRRAVRVDLDLAASARPSDAPLAVVRRRGVLVLGLNNTTDGIVSVAIAGHSARLLDGLDDGWKPFHLDHVLVPGNTVSRIAFATPAPGRYEVTIQPVDDAAAERRRWFEVW